MPQWKRILTRPGFEHLIEWCAGYIFEGEENVESGSVSEVYIKTTGYTRWHDRASVEPYMPE